MPEKTTLGNPRRVRDGERTKSAILDASEELFAELGFDAVPVRIVAARAGIALGLATHHFPTKEQLFEAVIERRAGALTQARRERFSQLRPDASLDEVLDAFVRPYLEFMISGDSGWHAYGRLIASLSQSPRWTPLVTKYFGAFGRIVMARIQAAEPTLSREAVIRGYVFFISVMMGVFASTHLLDSFSQGDFRSEDLESAYDPMLRFVVAGIRGEH